MRIIGFLLAMLLCPALARAGCTVQPRTAVPLHVFGGTIAVTVTVNGIEALFILDTGAARSVVTRAATTRLNLARDEWVGTSMRGIGGVERLPNANPRSISLGGVALFRRTLTHDTSLTVGSLPRTEVAGRVIDGLLGRDFLSAFDLALDMPGKALTLYDVSGCTGRFLPWTRPYTALPVENPADTALVIRITLDGVALRALLDTGAGRTLVAAPGMARLGLNAADMAADPTQSVSGLGPNTVTMHRHRFQSLRAGASVMEAPALWVAPVRLTPITDMLLGADFLAGRHLWISFTTRQVFVAD